MEKQARKEIGLPVSEALPVSESCPGQQVSWGSLSELQGMGRETLEEACQVSI